MTTRQQATIRAALAYWSKRNVPDYTKTRLTECELIATAGRTMIALDAEEIDALAKELSGCNGACLGVGAEPGEPERGAARNPPTYDLRAEMKRVARELEGSGSIAMVSLFVFGHDTVAEGFRVTAKGFDGNGHTLDAALADYRHNNGPQAKLEEAKALREKAATLEREATISQ